jgi:hypothetical protein
MLIKRLKLIILLLSLTASGAMMFASSKGVKAQDEALCKDDALTRELTAELQELGYTGRIQYTLEDRLGRRIDRKLADLGRQWFWRHTVDRHWNQEQWDCRPTQERPTKSAPYSVDSQHGILPDLDVELAFCVALK